MKKQLRIMAISEGVPLMDYILQRIKKIQMETLLNRTIFSECPNSLAVDIAALKAARRCNSPIKFTATLNQVDIDGGYTGLTYKEFVNTIREQARIANVTSPVLIAIDHRGSGLKDLHRIENWSLNKTMVAVKKFFESAIEAGYELIHIETIIDVHLSKRSVLQIEIVVERTLKLMEHTEKFRRTNNFPPIAYKLGAEEVYRGLSDIEAFKNISSLLKKGLSGNGLSDIWPCFIIGIVGTDLHTTTFDSIVAKQLTNEALKYESVIKGIYSDTVSNPEDYPISRTGAANVSPEFTEYKNDGLMELVSLAENLFIEGKLSNIFSVKDPLKETVVNSG